MRRNCLTTYTLLQCLRISLGEITQHSEVQLRDC